MSLTTDVPGSAAWWRREIPWPRPSAELCRTAGWIAVALSLAGILAVGADTTVWYLAAPGLASIGFGGAGLRRQLGSRIVQGFQVVLLTLWFIATIRWCVTDELALGFWGMATGAFLFVRVRNDRLLADRSPSPGPFLSPERKEGEP